MPVRWIAASLHEDLRRHIVDEISHAARGGGSGIDPEESQPPGWQAPLASESRYGGWQPGGLLDIF